MSESAETARAFLLAKLLAQANRDGLRLDDIEKRMFFYSESSGKADLDTRTAFDQAYDATEYEAKVSKLLRKAYARDKRAKESKREWTDALHELRRDDFYGLVMIDQAGIPRSRNEEWAFYLEQLPFDLVEVGLMVVGFLVVFRPSTLHLSLPDWVRWLAYPLFVWLVWYIGRAWGRMQNAKPIKRSDGPSH